MWRGQGGPLARWALCFYWFFHDKQTYPYPDALDALQWVVEQVGVDKLLWGSDYPMALALTTYKQMLDLIRVEAKFLADKDRKLILGANAQELLTRWQHDRL